MRRGSESIEMNPESLTKTFRVHSKSDRFSSLFTLLYIAHSAIENVFLAKSSWIEPRFHKSLILCYLVEHKYKMFSIYYCFLLLHILNK